MPDRSELFTECSCPDAETFGACKHGLAVLLVLADEISIDPAVLERWRSAGSDPADATGGDRANPRSTSWPMPCAHLGRCPSCR